FLLLSTSSTSTTSLLFFLFTTFTFSSSFSYLFSFSTSTLPPFSLLYLYSPFLSLYLLSFTYFLLLTFFYLLSFTYFPLLTLFYPSTLPTLLSTFFTFYFNPYF